MQTIAAFVRSDELRVDAALCRQSLVRSDVLKSFRVLGNVGLTLMAPPNRTEVCKCCCTCTVEYASQSFSPASPSHVVDDVLALMRVFCGAPPILLHTCITLTFASPSPAVDDVLTLMRHGQENRHVGETRLNRESSRSHSVFTCTVEVRDAACLQ